MKKEKIINMIAGCDDRRPTLLTDAGNVYIWSSKEIGVERDGTRDLIARPIYKRYYEKIKLTDTETDSLLTSYPGNYVSLSKYK